MYKNAYPFVQGLEFVAVQIIAVNSVQKSGLCISRLPVESRSSYPKHRFDRRFEPFSESRGPQTSGVLLVLFVQAKRIKPFPFRNFLTAESMPLSGQHAARAFTPFLLETWSPCSHPFAILPVSAVSDAQKLATGNFLHVRAGSFEVLQTSNQRTQVAVSHRPIKFLPLRGKYKRHVKRVVFCRKSS